MVVKGYLFFPLMRRGGGGGRSQERVRQGIHQPVIMYWFRTKIIIYDNEKVIELTKRIMNLMKHTPHLYLWEDSFSLGDGEERLGDIGGGWGGVSGFFERNICCCWFLEFQFIFLKPIFLLPSCQSYHDKCKILSGCSLFGDNSCLEGQDIKRKYIEVLLVGLTCDLVPNAACSCLAGVCVC